MLNGKNKECDRVESNNFERRDQAEEQKGIMKGTEEKSDTIKLKRKKHNENVFLSPSCLATFITQLPHWCRVVYSCLQCLNITLNISFL
jgi:hypothetical protein